MRLSNMESGQILIRRRGVARIRQGHLWVYRSDILNPEDAEPGSIVSVRDERETILGKAFFSSKSQISLRFLSRGDAPIDEAFFQQRFALADRLRERLGVDPLLSRRIYSEGDLLPGWVIDRYGDRLVVQSLIQATDRLQPLVQNIVMDRYRPRSILFRNDSRVRELEGLELKQEVAGDPIPDLLVINEDGKEIAISLTAGQKTGSYLDQRDNRRAARRYARGRALDAFSYTGGFAVQIADRCDHVEAVDISPQAVALARSNAERNGLKNVECIEANAFDFLRERHKEGGRVEGDGIVALAFFMPLPQEVEGVSLYALPVFWAVGVGVRPGQRHGLGGNGNGFKLVAPVGDLNGKSSGIAERIERAAGCVAARRAGVIALVEVGSGFLARR